MLKHGRWVVHVDVHEALDFRLTDVGKLAFADLTSVDDKKADVDACCFDPGFELFIIGYVSGTFEIKLKDASLYIWVLALDICTDGL